MTLQMTIGTTNLNDRVNTFIMTCDFARDAPVRTAVTDFDHAPGGRVGQSSDGVKTIQIVGRIVDTLYSNSSPYVAAEQRYHALLAEFRKPYARLVMTAQGDARFWPVCLVEVGEVQWLAPHILEYSVTLVAEHPYARALYPVADVAAAPSFSTVVDPVPPAGNAYKTAILALRPRAYWRQGEAAGATVMIDSSGNGCHGEYVASPTLGVAGSMAGESDTAVTYASASSQYARTTVGFSPLDTNNTFTYAFAVKRASTTGTQVIFSEGPAIWVVQIYFNSSNKLVLEAATGQTIYTSTMTLNSTSSWYHIVITKSGSTTTCYINGSANANASGSDFTISTAGSGRGAATIVHLGANRASANFLNGTLDEFAVFGEALSASQVSELYAIWSGSTDAMRGATSTLTTGGDVPVPVRTLWSVNTGSTTCARWQVAGLTPPLYGQVMQRARVSYSAPPRSIGVMCPQCGGAIMDATTVVGYWPLADASGNARDFSGSDYTLTATGTIARWQDGPWQDGIPHGWGGSVRCNGSGSYFSSSQTAFDAGTALTAGLWVNLVELTGGVGVLGKAESNKGWSLYVASDGTVNAAIGTGAAASTASSITKLRAGTWYHLALSYYYDGASTRRLRVYVDALREGETAPAAGPSASTNNFVLGRTTHTDGTTYHCNGYLTEAWVLSTELTQQQIRDVRRLTLPFIGNRRPVVGYIPELDPSMGATNGVQLAAWNTAGAPTINRQYSWRPEWR